MIRTIVFYLNNVWLGKLNLKTIQMELNRRMACMGITRTYTVGFRSVASCTDDQSPGNYGYENKESRYCSFALTSFNNKMADKYTKIQQETPA